MENNIEKEKVIEAIIKSIDSGREIKNTVNGFKIRKFDVDYEYKIISYNNITIVDIDKIDIKMLKEKVQEVFDNIQKKKVEEAYNEILNILKD